MGAATKSNEIQFKILEINLKANGVQFKLKMMRVHLVLTNQFMVLFVLLWRQSGILLPKILVKKIFFY